MASQVLGGSTIPPYQVPPYSTPADCAAKFGGASTLFTTATVPTTAQVQSIINRKDSWINQFSGHDFYMHTVTERYDATGSGRRAGKITLDNGPVISVESIDYWHDGIAGWVPVAIAYPGQITTKTVTVTGETGTQSFPMDSCYFYPYEGRIIFHKLRYDQRQWYRVRYTYGYASPPEWVSDLSAWLSAQEVVTVFAGKFMPPADSRDYKAEFELEIQRILSSAPRRPLSGVG